LHDKPGNAPLEQSSGNTVQSSGNTVQSSGKSNGSPRSTGQDCPYSLHDSTENCTARAIDKSVVARATHAHLPDASGFNAHGMPRFCLTLQWLLQARIDFALMILLALLD